MLVLVRDAEALWAVGERPLQEFYAEQQRDPAPQNQAKTAITNFQLCCPSSIVSPGALLPDGAHAPLVTAKAIQAGSPCRSIASQAQHHEFNRNQAEIRD
jgi:hypothetical protein